MSHTPGKWSYDEGMGQVLSDIDDNGFVVCTVESNDEDGPLIAQAPALLEVADMIVAHVGTNCDIPEGILRAATIAVSRAKGRLR